MKWCAVKYCVILYDSGVVLICKCNAEQGVVPFCLGKVTLCEVTHRTAIEV